MSGASAVAGPASRAGGPPRRSLAAQRRWALWGSYATLLVFVIMFLVPPFYMVMTSVKGSAEISAQQGSPWFVRHPTLQNYIDLFFAPNFRGFFINSVEITIVVVVVSMVSVLIRLRSPA